MNSRTQLFIDDVMTRGVIADQAQALEVVKATLEMVGECLPAPDASTLAESLPGELAGAVRRAQRHPEPTLRELFEHVSQRAQLPIGEALEKAEAVGAALAEYLPIDVRSSLQRRLPSEWARLLEPRTFERGDPAPWHNTNPAVGSTLAAGRPGSRHPLSEAAPPAAQSASVAASENPHAETKLSSSHGVAPEEPLATGHAGSGAPLADARDRRPDR